MSSFRVRPRFEQLVELTPDETRARILKSLAQRAPDFEVKDFPGFIGLHIAEGERRYWSPRLFLTLDATAEGATRIHGTYGPEIEVWGIFLYGYLITGLLGTFSGALGFAQRVVDSTPWGFWVTGSMAIIAGLLYLGAQFGQKLGAWQTFQLHQAFQAAVGAPVEIH